MNTSVGRVIIGTLIIFALVAGVYLVIEAAKEPSEYDLDDASAMQVTQVYTMELFDVAVIIALILAAMLFIQVVNFMDVGQRQER